ncbi:MAG TPA: hypothetical protein VFR86_00745 [Burkholderiaceae bacterium]|nr:hypothetical protein [Burkholderiaceae bacterium]
MVSADRRKLLRLGLLGSAALWGGCSGGSDGDSAQAEGSRAQWNIAGLVFVQQSDQSIDLAETLPNDVRRGGTFSVHPGGAALPAGMMLSPAGRLAVGSAAVGQTSGVVFSYEEPAG